MLSVGICCYCLNWCNVSQLTTTTRKKNSLDHQQQQQNQYQPKLVISNNYGLAKRTHRIPIYFVNIGFDVNAGNEVAIGVKWKKCSYEHLVFVNNLIVLKEKYLYQLILWMIDRISDKNDETSKCTNIIYKNVKSVMFIYFIWKLHKIHHLIHHNTQ